MRPNRTIPRRINRPDADSAKPLALVETVVPPELFGLVNAANSYVRSYRLGECSVLVTKEFGEWHLSIAHRRRYPTWDEVAEARYRLVPDEITMAMLLPPRSEYVNVHRYCFQMVEIPTYPSPLALPLGGGP